LWRSVVLSTPICELAAGFVLKIWKINERLFIGAGRRTVLPNTITNTNTVAVIRSAAQYRLSTIFTRGSSAAAGALAGHGPEQVDQYRRAASYADRILKGKAPSNLPVHAPAKFELVINLGTAEALSLTISPTLLATADRVIEWDGQRQLLAMFGSCPHSEVRRTCRLRPAMSANDLGCVKTRRRAAAIE